jgi:cytochrome b561
MNALHSSDARRGLHHAAPAIALHWLSAFAVGVAFCVAWTREALDDPGPRAALMSLHQAMGLLVFGLLLARVSVRIAKRRHAPRHEISPRVRAAPALVQAAMYLSLLAMPLLGWALTNAHGHDVRLAGWVALPQVAEADPDLAETLEAWHVGLAWVLGGLIALHAAAAFHHHLVRRDGVLRSMLPRRKGAAPAGPE